MREARVAFQALPGSQTIAMLTPCDHTLYCGTRGAGKTEVQLATFAQHVGKGYGHHWTGIILDREHKNLDDIRKKAEVMFEKLGRGCEFKRSASQFKFVWATGEQLLLRPAAKIEDYQKYHGHEYAFIGWNELTKYATPDLYDLFMSVNRSGFDPDLNLVYIDADAYRDYQRIILVSPAMKRSMPFRLPRLPLQVFSTTNPMGPGHSWVKRRFIDGKKYGEVTHTEVEIVDREDITKTKKVVKSQVAIFGSFVENPYLDDSYIAELYSMTDKMRRKAWLLGSWDVVAGGAIDDLWDSRKHILPRFVIPDSWPVDRTFDDGSSHPFAVAWFAESDGTEALIEYPNGEVRSFCPPAGSIIQFAEWYGGKEVGTNVGLKLGASAIAKGIIDRESALMKQGYITRQPKPGPADNRIRAVIDKDLDTTEKIMEKQGVKWTSSDKSAGSRIIGLNLLRERLERAVDQDGPGFYVMSNCTATIALLPSLPRSSKIPDDVDTTAEDHMYDAIRYRLLNAKTKTKPTVWAI
nr:large terminase protein [Caudoviricetes sp.]